MSDQRLSVAEIERNARVNDRQRRTMMLMQRIRPFASHQDYYRILGVSKTSNLHEIKTSYRQIALTIAPDKNPGLDTTAIFQAVNKAYDVLSDESKRREYDSGGQIGILGNDEDEYVEDNGLVQVRVREIKLFRRQSARLQNRLRVADPSLSSSERDDISNAAHLLLDKFSSLDLSQVYSSPMPFLELVRSTREDLKQFHDLTQQLFTRTSSVSPLSQQYGEDREDIEQDLQQMKQIIEDLTDESQHWNQQMRSLLQDARTDLIQLVSLSLVARRSPDSLTD
jgi:curved DNA-binding protein CbpA